MTRLRRSPSVRGCTLVAKKSGPRRRANANRRPDHKENWLLMAKTDPTGSGRTVALHLDPLHVAILRDAFTSCLEGLRGDLETPDKLRDPDRSHREAGAYERLLAALEGSALVVSDETARQVVTTAAATWDEANEYERIVAEHDALYSLLSQMGERQQSDG